MARDIAKANRAIAEAWKREKELVKKGMGTRDWTSDQQKDILATGKVHDADGKAFEGHHMKCVSRYPDFQGEPDNIQFLSREEHIKAHGGKTQNPTNGYYDYLLEKTTVTFDEDTLIPIEPKPLKELADEVKEIMAKSEQPIEEAKEEQDEKGKMGETSNGIKTDRWSNGNAAGQPVTLAKQTPSIEKRQSNNDNKTTKRFKEKPHGVKQPEKKGWRARLSDAIRDKHREILRREFYDEYGDYYDDPVEKFEAMRAHVDEHEGDSLFKCSFHILRYGKRTYADPVLGNPMVQSAIGQAVSSVGQRILSGSVSRNESTGAGEANKTRQGGKAPSSAKSAAPNAPKPDAPKSDVPKPDVLKPDSLPTPDSNVPDEGTGKGTPKSPHPRKGYEGYRIKRNDDGKLERKKVPVKPTFIHPEQVETESNDDN